MKKIILGAALLLTLLLFTGCGNENKLYCFRSEDEGRVAINAKFDKDDKITNIKLTMSYDYDTEEDANTTYDMLKEAYDEGNKDGAKLSIKKTGKTVSLIVDIDLSKATEEMLEEYDLEDYKNYTKTEFKEEFEDSEFSCN